MFGLLRAGRSAQRIPVGQTDLLRHAAAGLAQHALGQGGGLLVHEVTIEKRERLQWRDRGAAARPRLVAHGGVERLHERHVQRSLLVDVNAALSPLVTNLRVPLVLGIFNRLGDVAG